MCVKHSESAARISVITHLYLAMYLLLGFGRICSLGYPFWSPKQTTIRSSNQAPTAGALLKARRRSPLSPAALRRRGAARGLSAAPGGLGPESPHGPESPLLFGRLLLQKLL